MYAAFYGESGTHGEERRRWHSMTWKVRINRRFRAMLASRPSIKGGARPRIDEASHSNIVSLSNTITRSSNPATTKQHTQITIMQYVVHTRPTTTHRLLEPRFSVNSLAMILATAITTTMAAPTNNLAVSVFPQGKVPPMYSHQSNSPPSSAKTTA